VDLLIGGAIAALFLVPALWRPRLGRALLSLMFICGGLFNLLYTLPNAPDSLLALVATAPIPPYREVVGALIAWSAAPALIMLVAAFEVSVGLLILWRGPFARLAMMAAGVILSRRDWRPWLVLPVAFGLPALVLTGDWNAALAGFLAVGITVAGGLVFGRHWWAPYLLVASGVALVLLLAPDSFTTFGLIFLVLEAIAAGAFRHRLVNLFSGRLSPAKRMPAWQVDWR
jgi:hypothetical protein